MAERVRLTKRKGNRVFVVEDCVPDNCVAYSQMQDFCSRARNCKYIKDRSCPYLAMADRLAEYEDGEYSK